MKYGLVAILSLLFHANVLSEESNRILLTDSFDHTSNVWKAITFKGKAAKEIKIDGGKVLIMGSDGVSGAGTGHTAPLNS